MNLSTPLKENKFFFSRLKSFVLLAPSLTPGRKIR